MKYCTALAPHCPLLFCRSYIKLINMVSGSSGQMQVNNISGYLPGRIVFFLLNTHITPRPVLLTRHGESQYNVSGRIGGDPPLSPRGEEYSTKLAEFLQKRLRHERMASVRTPPFPPTPRPSLCSSSCPHCCFCGDSRSSNEGTSWSKERGVGMDHTYWIFCCPR